MMDERVAKQLGQMMLQILALQEQIEIRDRKIAELVEAGARRLIAPNGAAHVEKSRITETSY